MMIFEGGRNENNCYSSDMFSADQNKKGAYGGAQIAPNVASEHDLTCILKYHKMYTDSIFASKTAELVFHTTK